MSETFKAVVINQDGENFSREIKEVDKNFLEGDVLVKIDYSDLNYKDALILNDGGKLVKEFPNCPLDPVSNTILFLKLNIFLISRFFINFSYEVIIIFNHFKINYFSLN